MIHPKKGSPSGRNAYPVTEKIEELKKEEEAAKQEAALKAQQSSIGSLFMEAAASIAPPPTNAKVKHFMRLKKQKLH